MSDSSVESRGVPLGRMGSANRHLVKAAGAFFTPPELAGWIVERALDKALAPFAVSKDRRRPHGLWTTLLNFRVCDPAVGDGVFLVAAGLALKKRIETAVARWGSPPPRVGRRSDLDAGAWVLQNTMYGVDLDPNSVVETRRKLTDALCPDAGRSVKSACAKHIAQGDALLDRNWAELPIEQRNPRIRQTSLSRFIDKGLDPVRSSSPRLEFSWSRMFPEVFHENRFENPGFDVVVGNPPWEVLKPQDREFFASIAPGFSALSKDERERRKSQLLTDPAVREGYDRYVSELRSRVSRLRESGLYQWQLSERVDAPGSRELNAFRLFLELGFTITKSGGWLSMLLPSSFFGELNSSELRRLILERSSLDWIAAFHPMARVFGKVDQPYCIFLTQRGHPTGSFRCVGDITNLSSLNWELPRAPAIPVELVTRVNPRTLSFFSATSKDELRLLEKLNRFPKLGDVSPDCWVARTARELDETRDRHLLTRTPTRFRFLKGNAVFPYRIDWKMVDLWIREEDFLPQSQHSRHSRVVWRDIARPNMARRMFATICPEGFGVGNSLNFLIPEQSEEEKLYLIAMLNSLVFEYLARQVSRNSHMNMFVIQGIPVPRLRAGDFLFDKIQQLAGSITNRPVPEDTLEEVAARVDALVGRAYGLTARDLRLVHSRFPRVSVAYKAKVMDAFGRC